MKYQTTNKQKNIGSPTVTDSQGQFFEYYKEISRRLLKKHDKLTESLGKLMGFAIGYSSVAENEAKEFIQRVGKTINNFSRVALVDSQITKKEMEKNGLNSIPEFNDLDRYIEEVKKINIPDDLSALQKDIVTLIELYSYLYYCHQLMLEKQIVSYSKIP